MTTIVSGTRVFTIFDIESKGLSLTFSSVTLLGASRNANKVYFSGTTGINCPDESIEKYMEKMMAFDKKGRFECLASFTYDGFDLSWRDIIISFVSELDS